MIVHGKDQAGSFRVGLLRAPVVERQVVLHTAMSSLVTTAAHSSAALRRTFVQLKSLTLLLFVKSLGAGEATPG